MLFIAFMIFCSQNQHVKTAILNTQKSRDVEASQGKGGGVEERSLHPCLHPLLSP